jgi:hypothetical protein
MLIDFLRSDGVDKLLKQLPENDIAEADELMVFIDEKRHRPKLYLSTKIRNKIAG